MDQRESGFGNLGTVFPCNVRVASNLPTVEQMFTRASMVAAGLVLMSVVDSDAVAEDTSGGRWYVGGGLGAATSLELCSAFNPGFTTARFDKRDCRIELAAFNPFLSGKPGYDTRAIRWS